MPAAYSIQCPACGAAFLATQTRTSSITTCPHCAYNAPLQAFQAAGMSSLGDATALPVRRRNPRQQVPQPLPLPQPIQAHQPPPAPALPIFPETQESTSSPPPTPVQLASIVSALPPLTPARPTLPQPDSFIPQTEFAALAQAAPQHSSRSFWLGLLGFLAVSAVSAGAAWLLWQNRSIEQTPAEMPPSEEIRPAVMATQPPLQTEATRSESLKTENSEPVSPAAPMPAAAPAMSLIEFEALSDRVLKEGEQIFRNLLADPVAGLTFIDQSEKAAAQVAAFFERHPSLTATSFQKVPVAPRDLQTGQPVLMLQVTTSANTEGGALLRFHISEDDRMLLDWPLFEETHENALQHYINSNEKSGSRWFTVGLRRNHGLELDNSMRQIHHVFDLQASAKSLLDVPGIVVRDLPVGRYLDQRTEWQAIHTARLLLRSRTLESGLKCVEIVDCEGLGLSNSRNATGPKSVPN